MLLVSTGIGLWVGVARGGQRSRGLLHRGSAPVRLPPVGLRWPPASMSAVQVLGCPPRPTAMASSSLWMCLGQLLNSAHCPALPCRSSTAWALPAPTRTGRRLEGLRTCLIKRGDAAGEALRLWNRGRGAAGGLSGAVTGEPPRWTGGDGSWEEAAGSEAGAGRRKEEPASWFSWVETRSGAEPWLGQGALTRGQAHTCPQPASLGLRPPE